MKTVTYTLPSHWASYLINGDSSSFSLNDDGGNAELKMIDDWCEANNLGFCLDCTNEEEFSWHNDGPQPNLGNSVADFTFELRETDHA